MLSAQALEPAEREALQHKHDYLLDLQENTGEIIARKMEELDSLRETQAKLFRKIAAVKKILGAAV